MAEPEPNPAQHLQRQRQPRPQIQPSKCRHVRSPCSWGRSWSRVAWLLAAVCLLTRPVMPEVIYRVDPLALLAATLRTYQRAGCDSEQLSLSCPRGTSISIELAQYGRAGDLSDHSLCPPVSQEDLTTTGSAGDAVIHSGTEIEVKPPETCTVSGLQYALLQTVVDACQKKRHCKFAANSKTHTSGDPCSGIRKFVEIAYKCRPYEFRSKLACENDNMPLMCNPYSRIAIYSASFGHTERESVQCGGQGAPAGSVMINREENGQPTCLVSYATETVMQICHGRRRCSVTADAGTFGRPCKADVRMYLKVVYTCIPRKVLKDRYETAAESDEPQQTDLDLDQDELYDEDQFYKESEAIPPAPKLQGANVGRSFDFGANNAAEEASSTLLPPLLSRNDGSLEERLQSSVRLLSRIKESFNHQLPTEMAASTTLANEHIITTTDGAPNEDNEDKAIELATVGSDSDAEANTVSGFEKGNFFYRRKCQMVDDWGPIGLNCTEEDIVTERVEVVGFLANWLHTYLHIRKHQEQFYLYLIISVTAGVLLCLTLVIGRLTLQRRGGRLKRSSSVSGVAKNFAETPIDGTGGSGAGGGSNFQQMTTGETHLADTFGDDISDIDVDVDLTTPVPLSSLSSRNETYMTYAPTPNCSYGGLPGPQAHHPSSTATSVLMAPPSQANIYTSMGHPAVSGAMTIGPHMLGPSSLSGVAPAYLSGTIMVPGHQHTHAGTLRRTLIPTSMGLMSSPSPPPAMLGTGGGMALPPHSLAATSGSGVYYDSTVPRTLARGISTESSGQYFFG
ncbi:uncharacterized protein [Drosophila virilis]|uniref:Uncharacterized protein, isoform A n=1 Tax=Drosophila virilis TaxID=7244 RepID=B4LXG0_DROVI|nr:uncharacterized protein LOC6630870 isoform X1 [Drosophila virilis]XP_015026947.1 uncharacterized protein LOC6630870 isoform X1 [Drosophila virilis]XP_032295039.1 uncharacterized protein LOC6630870 isoform X1 [Drosophila virilis]EDW67838.1 uncharacterized protein Dvir_GJ22866, isoform A [Drosophila virilis]KRF83508.1 uncharacterized protein Dvir_GJ22866, isoform B [Drosophila virilis]KRF83510.1 uncharacterized protein Dvir_GJ22866, isoform D [Drosophila virilis]